MDERPGRERGVVRLANSNKVATETRPRRDPEGRCADRRGSPPAGTRRGGRSPARAFAQVKVTYVLSPDLAFTEFRYKDNGYLTDACDQLRNQTTLEYQNVALDFNDSVSRWKTGRTIPHMRRNISARGGRRRTVQVRNGISFDSLLPLARGECCILRRLVDQGVREGGVEPPRPFGHRILSPARLPFRHSRGG